MDGVTVSSNKPERTPRLDVWDDSDQANAIFLDTNGGEIGMEFSVLDLRYSNSNEVPHHFFETQGDIESLVQTDQEKITNHRYRVTDCLSVECELLISAEHVSSNDQTTLTWEIRKQFPR